MKALIELIDTSKENSPERKVLEAHLIYEAEFFAARNSGRDKGTLAVNMLGATVAAVGAGFFYWQGYQAIQDFPDDYWLQAMLIVPALASSGVALVFGARVDRIRKERAALNNQAATLQKLQSREGLKKLGFRDSVIDQMMS